MTTSTHSQVNADAAFREGSRPPIALMPKELAELVLERDRIELQRSAAGARVAELTGSHLDEQAEAADAAAAQEAARAGKPIPKTSRVAKLATDREDAARNLAAQEAALSAVTNDALNAASDAYPWADRDAMRAATRTRIEEAAQEFADTVEEAVAAEATVEWLRTQHYSPVARIEAGRVFDLKGHNPNGHRIPTARVRDAIVKAATAPFADQENR
jgi:hypothetical protein